MIGVTVASISLRTALFPDVNRVLFLQPVLIGASLFLFNVSPSAQPRRLHLCQSTFPRPILLLVEFLPPIRSSPPYFPIQWRRFKYPPPYRSAAPSSSDSARLAVRPDTDSHGLEARPGAGAMYLPGHGLQQRQVWSWPRCLIQSFHSRDSCTTLQKGKVNESINPFVLQWQTKNNN